MHGMSQVKISEMPQDDRPREKLLDARSRVR